MLLLCCRFQNSSSQLVAIYIASIKPHMLYHCIIFQTTKRLTIQSQKLFGAVQRGLCLFALYRCELRSCIPAATCHASASHYFNLPLDPSDCKTSYSNNNLLRSVFRDNYYFQIFQYLRFFPNFPFNIILVPEIAYMSIFKFCTYMCNSQKETFPLRH